MSIKLMAKVWEYQLTKAEQSVLLAMADHAWDDGSHCYPGVDLIAWKTDYSDRQVQRTIKDLTRRGILTVVRKAGRARPTEYKINLEKADPKPEYRPAKPSYRVKGDTMSPQKKGDTMSPHRLNGDTMSPHEREKVTFEAIKGDISALKGDIAMSPEPITNKPLASDLQMADVWSVCVAELCRDHPRFADWLPGSTLTATEDVRDGKRVYRLAVANPRGVDWLQAMGSRAICQNLHHALGESVALEIDTYPSHPTLSLSESEET